MASLWRAFVVLLFALLSMQGAQAHVDRHDHARFADVPSHAGLVALAGCADASADANPERKPSSSSGCHHGHCACCMMGCGVHCGALPVAVSLAAPVTEDSPPRTHPVTRYDGITRAPPVRPPIV
jgi:hypothetical protein